MHPIKQYRKNFLGRAYPELALAITLHNVTHHTTMQARCITMPPHYLENYTPFLNIYFYS